MSCCVTNVENKINDYTSWCQIKEKPNSIPCCPGIVLQAMQAWEDDLTLILSLSRFIVELWVKR